MRFKVGDKVVFKEEELSREWYRKQANGIGTITKTGRGAPFDVEIVWENGKENAYASCDLIKVENPMRTIPTKTQVLEAAKRCPQTKEALEILFPEDFEKKYMTVVLLNVGSGRQNHVVLTTNPAKGAWRLENDGFNAKEEAVRHGLDMSLQWYGTWRNKDELQELL